MARTGLPERGAPLGWSFNPSSWAHRRRLMALAAIGLALSVYLGLCQIGTIERAWDPFFGDGTERVLHSWISRAVGSRDAVVGAGAYLAELLLLGLGSEDRWWRRPWLAAASGLLAVALAATGLFLVFAQATLIGAWCTGCLLTAATSLWLGQRALAEPLACVQGCVLVRRAGGNPWVWLWRGGGDALLSPARPSPSEAWTEGTSTPPTLAAALFLGLLALTLPDLFGISGPGRASIAAAGVISIGAAAIAMSEPARWLRWAIGAAGTLLLGWFLGEPLGAARWIAAALGAGMILLCLWRGELSGGYGLLSSPGRTVHELDRRCPAGRSGE